MKPTQKFMCLLVMFMLFLGQMPAGRATESPSLEGSVNIEQLNNALTEGNKKDMSSPLSYVPKVDSFKKIGTEGKNNDVSKYQLRIKTEGGSENDLWLTIHMREDIRQSYKGFVGIFAGQSLCGKKFYTADYSDIEGARQGFVVIEADRREVNFKDKDKANKAMPKHIIEAAEEDYYVELATSQLLISQLTGIPVENIDTTVIGHSLGAHILGRYGGSFYQSTLLGQIDHFVFVDDIVKYDSGYEDLKAGQLASYNVMLGEIRNGSYVVDGMSTSILAAKAVNSGVPGAESVFDYAISHTWEMKTYPYTPDYHYWPQDVDSSTLANVIVNGGAVPYSSKLLDLDMTGTMAGVIEPNNIIAPKSILYVGLGGGFNMYGRQWFESQGADIFQGGNSGHGFMWNVDSANNWAYIWSYINSHITPVSVTAAVSPATAAA